jgi:hypothetical protein
MPTMYSKAHTTKEFIKFFNELIEKLEDGLVEVQHLQEERLIRTTWMGDVPALEPVYTGQRMLTILLQEIKNDDR